MNFNEIAICGTYVGLRREALPQVTASGATEKYIFELMYNPNKPAMPLETLNLDLLKIAKTDGVAAGVSAVCICRLDTNKSKDGRTFPRLYPIRLTTLIKWQAEQAQSIAPTAVIPAPANISPAAMAVAMLGVPMTPPAIPQSAIAEDNDLPF